MGADDETPLYGIALMPSRSETNAMLVSVDPTLGTVTSIVSADLETGPFIMASAFAWNSGVYYVANGNTYPVAESLMAFSIYGYTWSIDLPDSPELYSMDYSPSTYTMYGLVSMDGDSVSLSTIDPYGGDINVLSELTGIEEVLLTALDDANSILYFTAIFDDFVEYLVAVDLTTGALLSQVSLAENLVSWSRLFVAAA